MKTALVRRVDLVDPNDTCASKQHGGIVETLLDLPGLLRERILAGHAQVPHGAIDFKIGRCGSKLRGWLGSWHG